MLGLVTALTPFLTTFFDAVDALAEAPTAAGVAIPPPAQLTTSVKTRAST